MARVFKGNQAGTASQLGRRLFVVAVVCAVAARGSAQDVVRLPQDHEYQVILRNYIGSLKENDFAIRLEAVEFRERWVRDDETLHRLWVLALKFPSTLGLTLAPDKFLLRQIESPDGIRIRTGERGDLKVPDVAVYADDTVWWSTWNWRGNPYFGSRAVRNRAFVIAAVEMMMLDKLHESGTDWVKNGRRSDFLGGTMTWLAHVYHDVRGDLPEQVRAAYEAGLAKFLDRLEEWGPTYINENMDTKALITAAYIGKIFRDGPIAEKARACAKRTLQVFHPAGMIRDAGGLETSYNGCALFNIAHATAVNPWPEFVEMLRQASDLKGHLTLPEPDGLHFLGPSHFSTRTSADAANDQWAPPQRDIAIAMHADEAVYLMFGGRSGRTPNWAVPDHTTMARDVKVAVGHLNDSLKPSPECFKVWQENHWGAEAATFAHDHYQRGFYRLLTRLQSERHPATFPPLMVPGETFVRAFPSSDAPDVADADRDAFLVARFPEYAAIVYTGPLGWHPYMNFSGGCLSAVWTPASGAVVLGRTGYPVEPKKARQSWADWRLWPTHALSGQAASGDAFSSARIRRRASKVAYELGQQAATVTFSGPIGKQHDESRAAQNGCITGAVHYTRSMSLGPRGVVVETRLESDGTDRVTDLCEIIPLLLHDTKGQVPTPERPGLVVPHRVLFAVGEKIIEPGENFVDGVSAVQVDRFSGGVVIRFATPQRVRLGEVWTDMYQSAMSLQNLLIDLLGGASGPTPLPSVSVRYRIEPRSADSQR